MDQSTHQADSGTATATVDGGTGATPSGAADSYAGPDFAAVEQHGAAEPVEQGKAVLDIQRPPSRTDPLGDLPAPEPGPPEDPMTVASNRWADAVDPPKPLGEVEWFRSRAVGDGDQVFLLGTGRAVFTPDDDDTGRAATVRGSDEVAKAFRISAAPSEFVDGEPVARVFGEVAEARLHDGGGV